MGIGKFNYGYASSAMTLRKKLDDDDTVKILRRWMQVQNPSKVNPVLQRVKLSESRRMKATIMREESPFGTRVITLSGTCLRASECDPALVISNPKCKDEEANES